MNPFTPALVFLASAGVFYTPMKLLIPALILGLIAAAALVKFRRR